jgi:uncharacterized protein YgiB involved in biofilm formation
MIQYRTRGKSLFRKPEIDQSNFQQESSEFVPIFSGFLFCRLLSCRQNWLFVSNRQCMAVWPRTCSCTLLQGTSYCRRLPPCSGQPACGPYAETTVRGVC